MRRDLILGTAGHIDHGKTSLVKALTGVDCDRLPEEKARGITIDIGFAHLSLEGFKLGVVDVPGHERFVKNMLAGATGIDLALLVVAADDSIMPQTREHLEILKLLGIQHGVIALTKADLADETTREVVELEIRELVQNSFLAEAPIIPTSVHTGQGLEELKKALTAVCQIIPVRQEMPWFRLAIDRTFVVQGHGTVVTGTVVSGSTKVGDELQWLPRNETVRVRSLQNHDQSVQEVHRGMRAAINLPGVKHEDVIRGQELAHPGYLVPSRVITLKLYNLPAMNKAIKHRANVRFHAGTSEIMGTLSLLDADQVPPGKWALAQIFLEEPITTSFGQPFVIRSPAATATLGGGLVLQSTPQKIRRRHIEILERIECIANTTDLYSRGMEVAWFAGIEGIGVATLVRDTAMSPQQADVFLKEAEQQGKLKALVRSGKSILMHTDHFREIEERILTTLMKMHKEAPLLTLLDRQKLQTQLGYLKDDALVTGIVDSLIQKKQILGDAKRVAHAEHKPKLSVNQRKLKDKMVAAFLEANFQPPEVASFAPQAAGNAAVLKDIIEVSVAEGFLVAITPEIVIHADHETTMRQRVTAKLAEGKGLTVAEIRDLLNTSRKFAVPLCEYLDKVGVTKRQGDLRVRGT